MGVDIIIMRQQNFRIILSEEMIYWLNNITVDPSHTSVAILDRIMTVPFQQQIWQLSV